jgi:hypothetical protein
MSGTTLKFMTQTFFVSAWIASCGTAGATNKICNRDASVMNLLITELLKESRGRLIFEDSMFIAIADNSNSGVWTFTKSAHAAHPSVVCRYPEKTTAGIHIRMEAKCGGSKLICDALIDRFQSINP